MHAAFMRDCAAEARMELLLLKQSHAFCMRAHSYLIARHEARMDLLLHKDVSIALSAQQPAVFIWQLVPDLALMFIKQEEF